MKFFESCVCSAALALALLSSTGNAYAQDVDPSAVPMAQTLYEKGVALMDAKNYAEACPKLEQVTKIIPKGIGAHEALGDCFVGLGRLASGWGQYVQLEVLARAVGEYETATKAHHEAVRLRSKLAVVTIHVSEEMRNVAGLSVTWDGLVQGQGSWGTPIPVDAGKHLIEVKAPTRQTWNREVVVVADGVSLEERVPILKMAPVEVAKSGGVLPATTPPIWMRPLGIAGLTVGIAGLGVGGVLGGLAKARWDASKTEGECDADVVCNEHGAELTKQALGFARGADVALIVGGAFAVTGIVLLVKAPKETKYSLGQTSFQVQVNPSGIGLWGVW